MAHFGTSGGSSSFAQLFWFILTVTAIGLTAVAVTDFTEYRNMISNSIDSVAVALRLNQTIKQQFIAHAVLTVLLFLSQSWLIALVNLPLALVRALQYRQHALEVSPASITRMGSKAGGVAGLSPETRFYFAIAVYAITDLYFLYKIFSD